MKDYSWVVIGVLTILMVDSGQSYFYKCDDATYNTITTDPSYIKPDDIRNLVQDFHDDIVSTTTNYFNSLTDDIKDPKTFLCASMYKKPTDFKHNKVIFDVKYLKDDKIVDFPMEPTGIVTTEYKGISFGRCDECPAVVDHSIAYRFYSKKGVYGVYTCTWHSTYANKGNVVKEGYIKASFSLTRNADGTGKKELSPETRQLIEEAKAKANELGIDIVENVPYGCNTEPPRANTPSPKVSPTEPSPSDLPPPKVSPTERTPAKISSESKSLIHKYGIGIIILIVGGLAAQTAILYGTR